MDEIHSYFLRGQTQFYLLWRYPRFSGVCRLRLQGIEVGDGECAMVPTEFPQIYWEAGFNYSYSVVEVRG
jgi:hypothetical protein